MRDRIRRIITILFVIGIVLTAAFFIGETVKMVQTPSDNDIFGDSLDLFYLLVMVPVLIVECDFCICLRYFLQGKDNFAPHKTIINGLLGAFHVYLSVFAIVDAGAMVGFLFFYSILWFPAWLVARLVYVGMGGRKE